AQGERPRFRETVEGGPCEPGQLEADSPRPVRRDRGTSGRMVHRSVPCAVLHAANPEGGPVHVERDHVRCPGARDTPLHRVRPPFRPNRTEENHDGRMPPGRRELCAAIRRDGGFWKAPQRTGHDRPGVRPSGMGHMVYGPIAAFLVEFFPARIRYTCLSLPYHLGNGEFGGFTPLIFFAVYGATSGNLYLALLWPILVPIMTFVIGMIWLPETKDTKIWEEVTPATAYGGPASMSRAGADVGPTMK